MIIYTIFLLVLVLIPLTVLLKDIWKNYPEKSKLEKTKIFFWYFTFMFRVGGADGIIFISNVAYAKQVPSYTAVKIVEDNPEIYEVIFQKIRSGELKVEERQSFVSEIKKAEQELLKKKLCSKSFLKRKKLKKSFKVTRRRRINPR